MFKGIGERFGTAGEVMLYYVGFNIGYQTYIDYTGIIGSDEPEAIPGLAKTFLRTMGWRMVDIVKMDLKCEVKVRVYESFECGIGGTAYGHFSSGLVAGFFTQVFGRELRLLKPCAWRR